MIKKVLFSECCVPPVIYGESSGTSTFCLPLLTHIFSPYVCLLLSFPLNIYI